VSLSAHPEHITSKPIIGRSLAMCSIEKLSYIRNAHRSIGIFVTVHKFTTIARNRLPSALHVQSRPGHQTPNRTRHVARSHNRHPELGSGSISRLYPSAYVARWMLKRVQHDVVGNAPLRPPRLCVHPFCRPNRACRQHIVQHRHVRWRQGHPKAKRNRLFLRAVRYAFMW
jgi:hypothetical protein